MSWTRGHGCTRLIVRSPDLLTDLNSPVFLRDVVFYLGSDKSKDLGANFLVGGESSIASHLTDAMVFLPSADERLSLPYRFRCVSRMKLPPLAA
eukprot:2791235-Pleurochrysis_carterae.AAC.1